MTSPCWFPSDPGTGIFFPGDLIRATLGTGSAEGVIETFSHELTELLDGRPGDTAHVRTQAGDLIPVPVAAITAIADAAAMPDGPVAEAVA